MARKRWIGKTIVTVAVLGIAGAGTWYYLYGKGEPPPKYQTVVVDRGPIVQTVTASGQLQPLVSVDVSSQVSGRLLEVLVDFNSIVKKGDVLARIDPATFESSLSQSENELLNSRASLNLIRTNASRSRKLFEQNLISQSELDQVLAQLEQAEVNIRIRESAVESRQTDLSRCTIYAPIDGVVITRNVSAGNTVAASLNAPTLFIIANDLTQMQIGAPVSEADIGRVRDGMDVTFTVDAFAGRNFSAKVRQVRNSPKTVDSVVTYETIIDVENPEGRLRPGMTANVSIIVDRRDEALRLANAAMRVRLPEKVQTEMTAKIAAMGGPGAGRPGEGRGPGPAGNSASPPAGPGTANPEAAASSAPAGIQVAAAGTSTSPAVGATPPTVPPSGERGERRRRDGSGAGGPGGWAGRTGENGAMRMRGDATVSFRVIYRLTGTVDAPQLEPVRVRTGISDMSFTEIMGEVKEGEKFVTAVILPGQTTSSSAASMQRPGQSGFPGMSGGGRRP